MNASAFKWRNGGRKTARTSGRVTKDGATRNERMCGDIVESAAVLSINESLNCLAANVLCAGLTTFAHSMLTTNSTMETKNVLTVIGLRDFPVTLSIPISPDNDFRFSAEIATGLSTSSLESSDVGVDKHATGRMLDGRTFDALPTERVTRMSNDPDQLSGDSNQKPL